MSAERHNDGDVILVKTAFFDIVKECAEYGSYRCGPGGIIDDDGNMFGLHYKTG